MNRRWRGDPRPGPAPGCRLPAGCGCSEEASARVLTFPKKRPPASPVLYGLEDCFGVEETWSDQLNIASAGRGGLPVLPVNDAVLVQTGRPSLPLLGCLV